MDFKKLNATWQSAIYSNRLLLIANAGLAITVVLLSFKLSQSHERLIIVPPTVNDRYELDWHGATAEYYKDIALWLSGTMGAVSRSNVDYVTNVVNRFMDPAIAKAVTQKLQEYAFDPAIESSNATAWFVSRSVVWEEPTSKVFVTGEINTQVNMSSSSRKEVVFEYTLTMQDGKPFVTAFTSYAGHDARTAKWLRLRKEKEADMSDSDKKAEQDALTNPRGTNDGQ